LGVFKSAALLSLGIVTWLHGLDAAGLVDGAAWSGGVAHLLTNTLLVFPLAVAAILFSERLTRQWQSATASAWTLLAKAALISFVLALGLGATAAFHVYLDQALGYGPVHSFHGQPRGSGSGWLVPALLRGPADALVGYAAALPLRFLYLAYQSRCRVLPGKTGLAKCAVAASIGAIVLATSVAGVVASKLSNSAHARAAHVAAITNVSVGPAVRTGDFEVAVKSARWVRQHQEEALILGRPAPAPLPDRIYLEIELRNLTASERGIGRAAFIVRAPDGRTWPPLADDFPEILLDPEEVLATWFIFEVPAAAAGLELVSAAQPDKPRIAIGDDALGGIFGALCRVLAKPWNG
jgi:hypothetical protein